MIKKFAIAVSFFSVLGIFAANGTSVVQASTQQMIPHILPGDSNGGGGIGSESPDFKAFKELTTGGH